MTGLDDRPSHSSAEALEVQEILNALQPLLLDFIASAGTLDGELPISTQDHQASGFAQLEAPNAGSVLENLGLLFPGKGTGKEGLTNLVQNILKSSVNVWQQGFLDKLYASTNAVGVASELILAVLNTNVHVYKVSPALTVIEKSVSKNLASLFGLQGQNAGGLTQPGGSASNLAALVAARNTLFPESKSGGLASLNLVIFTSAHGHYSIEKAAQICGLGSDAVQSIPVDGEGRLSVPDLEMHIDLARQDGKIPFFVNATAGTTVYGSYDPLEDIARVCKGERLWFHVDASWGGAVVFSPQYRQKIQGSEHADSITFNPHKMLHVPIICSFLLVADLLKLWRSNTLPADYLFHNDELNSQARPDDAWDSLWDLGDVTLQCGRRGDALKFALGLQYYGLDGYETQVDHAFATAAYLAELVEEARDLVLLIRHPPCLQVCFYFAPGGSIATTTQQNSKNTQQIAQKLLRRGFMIDYAPGEQGYFFRVVVSISTQRPTVERLVSTLVELGQEYIAEAAISTNS